MNLGRVVKLTNTGKETFESMWDSKSYTIPSGGSIEIIAGIALHFQGQSEHLEISELTPEEIEARTPVNPLEENDRGEAFTAIKRGRRSKGE